MFYLIGTGISGHDSIPLRGLELARKSDYVFIERYTSVISDDDLKKLSELMGRRIVEVNREDLESNFESLILNKAVKENAALLVVGDPLTATTHIEFLKSCKENKIDYEVVHASSIFSSMCETGLHVYKFGRSCSIPYPEKNYNPTSYFDIIEKNHELNSHTIVFLDIKGDKKKYMTIGEGVKILLNVSREKKGFFNEETKIFGISRLGFKDQVIRYASAKELAVYKFSSQPHILIIPSINRIEEEYVKSLYSNS